MTYPEWTKPALTGGVCGAILASIIGFTWGGWTSASTAQELANTHAVKEVTLVMLPICLDAAANDPERDAKLTVLKDASSFARSRVLMTTGWATFPGTDEPNRDLANACVKGLKLDDS